jgi:predicted nucleic acid-binding protein
MHLDGPLHLIHIPEEETIATCPMILHEVLRGTQDARGYALALDSFLSTEILDSPTPLSRFEQAAKLYLHCRDAGVTPSSSDCLIAACAIGHQIPLFHQDTDFDHIARVAPLRLFTRFSA